MKVAIICSMFLVFLAIQPSDAFECYACSMNTCVNMDFNDPNNKMQCRGTDACFKAVLDGAVVGRGCGQNNLSINDDCEKKLEAGLDGEVCVCRGGLCNSAGISNINVALTALFAFLSVKIFS